MELDWFFDLYVYSIENPVLLYHLKDGKLLLKWEVDSVSEFNMPIVVKFNNQEHKIEMNNGMGEIEVGSNSYQIDPYNWILKERLLEDSSLETSADEVVIGNFELHNNYPNPFNPNTTIYYSLPNESAVTITVFDMLGKEIYQLISQKQPSGKHSIQWNGADHDGNKMSAGIYFYQLQASDFVQTKKMVLLK
jgi:flagellar hook assembly protein FlgD